MDGDQGSSQLSPEIQQRPGESPVSATSCWFFSQLMIYNTSQQPEHPSFSARQFSISRVPQTPVFNAVSHFQSGQVIPSQPSHCRKASEWPCLSSCGSSKVHKILTLCTFVRMLTAGPRSHEYRLLLGSSTGRIDNALAFRRHRPSTNGRRYIYRNY